MIQPEQRPDSEEMRQLVRGMQIRMRNYALHHCGQIGPRTLTALQDLGLFEDQADPVGNDVNLDILRDPKHPLHLSLPPGPLLLYLSQEEEPKRMVVEVPVLLYSELSDVRAAAISYLDRMVADGSLELTPKTKDVLEKSRAALLSDTPHAWRSAAIALGDAFSDEVLVALQGVRQSLQCQPVIQSTLKSYVPSVIHPTVSSLDSIALEVTNPESNHPKLTEVVASIVGKATNLGQACEHYYARLGYLPLAPPYGLAEIVARWMAAHPATDVWTEVWEWARGSCGPIPHYHACSVFVLHPQLVPVGKSADLWREILNVVHESPRKGEENVEREPWALRRELTRHFAYHLEALLPDKEGAIIASFAWWLAEQVASLFPDGPNAAQFYRKNWVESAAKVSAHVWLAASPRIGRSVLRYATATMSCPWATALLALMGTNLERLALGELSAESQTGFYESLVSALIGAIPFAVDSPAQPTYAFERPLGETAIKWAAHQPEEQRKPLEQLIETSRTLSSSEGLCAALRNLAQSSLADQVVVTLALKAKAHTDPTIAPDIWEVLSDTEWREEVLGKVGEPVLGLLIEAFSILQVDNQDKWFYVLPHYVADLCEKAKDDERRRQLFLYLIQTSAASDTVSALHRLLRGDQRARFVELATDYSQRVEAMWIHYPPWVQGRMRALLTSLRTV